MNSKQPILTKRAAHERGTSDHGWLHARFTFSFADYFDPDHMGFQSLRVMNNDTIQPGGGFGTHPHDNMEIFTYVIEGQLAHKDSMGNGAVIEAGNMQYMSAASGVTHSEFNPSDDQATLLYQIWLTPNVQGGEPRYAEKRLGDAAEANRLHLLFSGTGRDGSTAIRQDAEIYFVRLEAGHEITVPESDAMPHAWVQAVAGRVQVMNTPLATGDGLALTDATAAFSVRADEDSTLLIFRLS